MELKTDDNRYLISQDEKAIRDEQDQLIRQIKPRYFALGKLIDRFTKLTERLPRR